MVNVLQQWEGLIELLGSDTRTAGGLEFLHKYIPLIMFHSVYKVTTWEHLSDMCDQTLILYMLSICSGTEISRNPCSKLMMGRLLMLLGKLWNLLSWYHLPKRLECFHLEANSVFFMYIHFIRSLAFTCLSTCHFV